MAARAPEPIFIVHPDETMNHNKKTLSDLLASLEIAKAPHVLIGGLMAGFYGKPRATVGVDLLVPRRARRRLIGAMLERGYRAQESGDMVRFFRGGEEESAADVLWWGADLVLRAASKHTRQAVILGQRVTAVDRGAFVALKYHAAASPTRKYSDKHQDVTDISRVCDRGLTPGEEALAVAIVEKSYKGAGAHLATLLDDIRSQRPIKV